MACGLPPDRTCVFAVPERGAGLGLMQGVTGREADLSYCLAEGVESLGRPQGGQAPLWAPGRREAAGMEHAQLRNGPGACPRWTSSATGVRAI